jgi:succinoglycan biosynthesis transport protein ExoP
MDFKFYLAVFWRRFPYFLILVSLGTVVGLTIALTQKPIYVAEARLVVEPQQIPDELAASTVSSDASEQLQIIRQRIFTRANLLGLANRLGVYSNTENTNDRLRPDEKVEDLSERINFDVAGGFDPGAAIIVVIRFEDPSPNLAAAVTNEIVTLILQENIKMRTTVSGQTLDFFEQETEQLEQELSQMRAQILVFQEANLEALPDSLAFRRSQQAAAQERILELDRERTQLRDRRDRLIQLFEQTGAVGLLGLAARTAEEADLQDLLDELNRASALLSDDNPRISILQAQIAAAERIVSAQQAAASSASIDAQGTPLLTPFELQRSDLEGQIAFIDEQKETISEELDELAGSIAATPANALTLATLERNFENLRLQYDRAVQNRAIAEVGDTIEALSKGQRITVIEQAIPPTRPTRPNRRLIAAIGVAIGFGMGFGLIVLLELLNSTVRRSADIIQGLNITPFMTMPYMRTRGQIWQRRLAIVAALVVVFVGVPVALWYIDTNIQPLQPIFDEVLRRVGLL